MAQKKKSPQTRGRIILFLTLLRRGSYQTMASRLRKYLLLAAGSLFLAIGVAGVFIPLLPTTPLLLISAYCYMRSSERLYHWLIHHKILGAYIYNYITYRALPKRAKVSALVFLWLMLTISILCISNLHAEILLVVVGLGVSIHLLALKTL